MMNTIWKFLLLFGWFAVLTGCSGGMLKIEGHVINYPHEYISIYKVSDGELVLAKVKNIKADSLFSFVLPEGEDGFYYLGVDDQAKSVFAELYIRRGENTAIEVKGMKVQSETLPDPSFAVWQHKWQSLKSEYLGKFSRKGRTPAVVAKIIKEFDEDFEAYIASVKTSDETFDERMKLKAQVEYEMYWLRSSSMASQEVNEIMLQQEVFKRLLAKSFSSANILKVNHGSNLISTYPTFLARSTGQIPDDYLDYCINIFNNDTLKGQILKEHIIRRKKSGKDFQRLMAKYGNCLLTERQKSDMAAYESEIMKFAEGIPAIDFSYPDANGKIHALSDYKGKVVLVDVWATWCSPCKSEMPHLEKLIKHFHGNPNVVFIGLSIDRMSEKGKWEDFIKEHGLGGIQLIADKGFKSQVLLDYEITGVPRFMLFDEDGKIVSVNAPRPSNSNLKIMIDETLQ